MKALSHTKSNRVLFFLSLIFFTVLLGGCQNTDLIQKDVNIEKINQVISMVNQSEILLGINTLSNSEKSYAWHKTISEKTKELILNKSQSELVSEVLRELENPNYFDGSKRSEEIIRSLNNRARLLFNDDDYGNIFLLLVDKDEVVKSVSKKSKNGRNGVKAKDGVITDPQSGSGTGGTGYCTCSTSAQCWVYIWGWWGTCYWDQDQCYTHGYRVNGCGFTGADICDGKCGS